MDEFAQVFAQFQDHLAPRLDVYEQAIYLYVLRHTFIEGKREEVIGFKSARKKLAFGVGKAGTPPSEGIVYDKLKSLEAKGCIRLIGSERAGTRVQIVLPSEIPNLFPAAKSAVPIDPETLDFFAVPENRKLILEREEWRCFYCLAKLDENNHVIEHVISRPEGNNSYRNVVGACRRCNNRKSDMPAEDFLRSLYREGILSGDEFSLRLSLLNKLLAGELKPVMP
ncbi:MAG TPA: HNH endonuclease signature motif containing protein [Pseudomonas sp.]|nr:HNH endonuclease signature motif containing protein [Pseudomonas sp.]